MDRELVLALVNVSPQILVVAVVIVALVRFRAPLARFLETRDTAVSAFGFRIELKASDVEAAMRARASVIGDIPKADPSWAATGQVADRASRLREHIAGRTVLWVDDHPEDNRIERRLLRQMGIFVEMTTTNQEAEQTLGDPAERIDLIISDIKRDDGSSGLELLNRLTTRQVAPPLVFYVGRLPVERPTPSEAFAITNRPDALLNLVMDALDRQAARPGYKER